MINYKGYSFPRDILLFIRIIVRVLYYLINLNKKSYTAIIQNIRSKVIVDMVIEKSNSINHLKRVYRLVSYLLTRVLDRDKPCLIRSYIILEEALKLGLDVAIYIGVNKSKGNIKGHSWVLIDNQVFMENTDELSEYTVMLKG